MRWTRAAHLDVDLEHQRSTAATPPASEAAAVEHQFVAVIRQTQPQVVQIQTDSGLGSGVIFDTKGNIVTNAHVASRWIAGAA